MPPTALTDGSIFHFKLIVQDTFVRQKFARSLNAPLLVLMTFHFSQYCRPGAEQSCSGGTENYLLIKAFKQSADLILTVEGISPSAYG